MKITDKEIHGMAVSDSNEFFLQQLVSLDKNVHGNDLMEIWKYFGRCPTKLCAKE